MTLTERPLAGRVWPSTLRDLAGAMALLVFSVPASATLGGDAASVTRDQGALQARVTAMVTDQYTDYTLTLPDGGVVHEFVNAASRVFQVSWSGQGYRPDMAQILGTYFERFQAQGTGAGPTRRQAVRADRDFVLHSQVRNRRFSGTAHLPPLLPAGVEPLALPIEVN